MHNPRVYVVASDLRELLGRQLVARFASSLQQLRRRDRKKKLRRAWLSPTQIALLFVHALVDGLKANGVGINVSAREWTDVLGCKERGVTKAFAKLKALGLLQRFPRLVKCEWKDGSLQRRRADTDGVSYVTPAGMKWIAEREVRIRREVVLSTWEPGGVKRAVVAAAGLLGTLLERGRSKLRRIAARLSPSAKQDRPTAEDSSERSKRSALVARAVSRRPPAGSAHVARKGDPASDPLERQRLRLLFDRGRLTPWDAWPDKWRPLRKGEPRTKTHWWLIAECERWIERFEIETGATERRQPELRRRPDDPRPHRLADEGPRTRRRRPRVNHGRPEPAADVNQHNFGEYET